MLGGIFTVIYHASTIYHLLSCIVHRLAYNPNEKAVLLLLEHIKPLNDRKEFFARLERFHFFDTVRIVPVQSFKLSNGLALDENSSEEDIQTVINNISRTFEKWFKEDIRQYREIYVSSDISPCGIYLNSRGIPYNYMEDASGMLSEEQRYLSITKGNNKTNYIINEYLGCAGRSSNVKARLGDLKHQKADFYDEKAVNFSIYDIIRHMLPDRIDDLLGFFGSTNGKVEVEENSCLLLTQDINTLKIKDLDLQELTLTTLVDYMTPDSQLIIKPHPKDRWQNYRRIFPNAVILERAEPSELLPFTLNRRVKTALTASSTSVRGVDSFAQKAYSFTTEIEIKRENIDAMYIITETLKELGGNPSVRLSRINEVQMTALLDNAGILCGGNDVLIDGRSDIQGSEYYSTDGRNNKPQTSETYRQPCGNYSEASCKLIFMPFVGKIDCDFVIRAEFLPERRSLMKHKTVEIAVFCTDDYFREKIKTLQFVRHLKYTLADVNVTVTDKLL